MKNKMPLCVKIKGLGGKYMYDIFLAPLGLLEQKIISYFQCISRAQKWETNRIRLIVIVMLIEPV